MKTIDLSIKSASIEEIFALAHNDYLLVHTPTGKTFIVAEVDENDEEEDFGAEVALTRQNKAIMALLKERSLEPGKYTLDQVREQLDLASLE